MAKKKVPKKSARADIAADEFERSIVIVRGNKVLLDVQLAAFYGVETRSLIQAVKRNSARFPADFMFQLDADEWEVLRSQFVISSSVGHGGRRYAPYAFTEQGVAMLSSVLRSSRAIDVNIQIMRAFVRLRQLLSAHKEFADQLAKLEQSMRQRDQSVDQQFRKVFALLEQLFTPPSPPRKPIGFWAIG
jgi:hypothetical protein